MKKIAAILFAFAALCTACSEEEDALPDQRKRIVSFLTSTHQPRLVAESALEEAGQVPYYSTFGNTAYRYIDDVYNADRTIRVTETSIVTITFRAYVFNYANIVTSGTSITMPYYTNDSALQPLFEAEDVGLTPGAWTFEPLVIDMRTSDILKGLRASLVGCCQGDDVEVYMTYNMAYGDADFSIIPKQSPIAFFFTIDKVE